MVRAIPVSKNFRRTVCRSRFARILGGAVLLSSLASGTASCQAFSKHFKRQAHESRQENIEMDDRFYVRHHANGAIESGKLAADTLIQGDVYKVGTNVTFYRTGMLKEVGLSADTFIKGVKYRQRLIFGPGVPMGRYITCVWFHENGNVSQGRLAADTAIQGATYKIGTDIYFNENGTVWKGELAEDSAIQGTVYEAGTIVHFARSGNGVLVRVTIKGVDYKAGTLKFHESGGVKSGKLTGDADIQGVTYKAWTAVGFHKNGNIKYADLSADTTIQGITFKAFRIVEFHENDRVSHGTLAADTSIGAVNNETVYETGTVVWFDEVGRIDKAELTADTRIQGNLFKAGTKVGFYKNGEKKWGTLAVDTVIRCGFLNEVAANIPFKAGTKVWFRKNINWQVYKAELSADTIIQGNVFRAGTVVEFDESGTAKTAR
jgi:hypothetical protein